ncbi:ABC transporter permease [Schaalia suimastitidis]|uniref:ABC transporter permease n=1 Tax=Schaalia suimastitidis TaxID=121163 RepID=UPI0003FE82A4|nr:ABC transporter permease [Schaalia suimastitidis]
MDLGTVVFAALLIALPVTLALGTMSASIMAELPQREAYQWLGADERIQAVAVQLNQGKIRQDPYGDHTVTTSQALGQEASHHDIEKIISPNNSVSLTQNYYPLNVWNDAGKQEILMVTQTSYPDHSGVLLERETLAPGEVALSTDVAARLGVSVGQRLFVEVGATPQGRRSDATPTGTATEVTLVETFVDENSVIVGQGTVTLPTGDSSAVKATLWTITGQEPVTWDQVRQLNDLGLVVTSRYVLHHLPSNNEIDPQVVEETRLRQQKLVNEPLAVGEQIFIMRVTNGLESELWGQGSTIAMALIILVIIVESTMLVMPIYTGFQRRHLRLVAQLLAIGARPKDIRCLFYIFALFLAVASSATALVLMAAGITVLHTYLEVPSWQASNTVIVAAGLIAFLVCCLSAIPSAIHAGRTHAVAVLQRRYRERSRLALKYRVFLLLLPLGVATIVAGTYWGHLIVTFVGAILIAFALIGCLPWMLTGSSRFKGHRYLPWRLAVRDCIRIGHRTFPTMAALMTVVIIASATLVIHASRERAVWESAAHVGREGDLFVTSSDEDATTSTKEAELAHASMIVEQIIGTHHSTALRGVSWDSGEWGPTTFLFMVDQVTGDTVLSSEASRQIKETSPIYIIDDGTWLEHTQLLSDKELKDAREVLRNGGALIPVQTAVSQDGWAQLRVANTSWLDELTVDTEDDVKVAQVRARYIAAVDIPIISPQVAEQLNVPNDILGSVISSPTHVSDQELGALDSAFADADPNLHVMRVEGDVSALPYVIGLLVSISVLVSMSMVAAIALGRGRKEYALLDSLGAPPTLRRRIGTAQGLVLTAYTVPTAVIAGSGIGIALVMAVERATARQGLSVTPPLMLEVPWFLLALLLIGIPLVAGIASAMLVPSRRQPIRRIG